MEVVCRVLLLVCWMHPIEMGSVASSMLYGNPGVHAPSTAMHQPACVTRVPDERQGRAVTFSPAVQYTTVGTSPSGVETVILPAPPVSPSAWIARPSHLQLASGGKRHTVLRSHSTSVGVLVNAPNV